ncbi:PREDICTED: WAT1-related protein At1g43650 [Tarenaya hassleriana]|uniref:WAT1-related protein At1g43650 n=1 Tax=Tarenaya hassleriana TaxID=28532 RepID=UPI00053C3D38|nr:PREDICTED: WAT1-related protein At1g43650 [Tarenaya hassleriana]
MEKNHRPHIAMLFIQIIYAGMALFSKLAVSQGTNPFVFVFYRQAFATLVLAPFAFFLESGKSSPLSFVLLVKIFLISLCGLTMSLNLYYVAINYTTATFAAATTNTIPSITFVLALLFRLETLSLKKTHGLAKALGSAVGVSGAFVFAFVKGPSLINQRSGGGDVASNDVVSMSTENWLKGSITMLSANTSWCLWLVLQTKVMKEYPAKLRLVALQCFFSCIQTAIWAVSVDRDPSVWKLQLGLPLLSIAYCGIVVTGITYWLQVWAIEKRGPVFTSMFTPLALIITSILSSFLFKESLYLGSVGGAILMVGGLYSVLWGKTREETDKTGDIQRGTKEENIVLDRISTQH